MWCAPRSKVAMKDGRGILQTCIALTLYLWLRKFLFLQVVENVVSNNSTWCWRACACVVQLCVTRGADFLVANHQYFDQLIAAFD